MKNFELEENVKTQNKGITNDSNNMADFVNDRYDFLKTWMSKKHPLPIKNHLLSRSLLVCGIGFILISVVAYLFEYLLVSIKYTNNIILITTIVVGFLLIIGLWLLWNSKFMKKTYSLCFVVKIIYILLVAISFSFLFYLIRRVEITMFFGAMGFSFLISAFIMSLFRKKNIKLNWIFIYSLIGFFLLISVFLIVAYTTNITSSYFGIPTELSNYAVIIFIGCFFALIHLFCEIYLILYLDELKNNKIDNQYWISLGIKFLLDIFFISFLMVQSNFKKIKSINKC